MNTKRVQRNRAHEYNISEALENTDTTPGTDRQIPGSFRGETTESTQAPIFNIHIHVPENFDRNSTKLYLPRIQPIIHVHFNEPAEKLTKRSLQQDAVLDRTHLQNIIAQSMPKYENVIFHFKNNSFNSSFVKTQSNVFNEKQILREKDSRIEMESTRSLVTETMQRQQSNIIDECSNNTFYDKVPGKEYSKLSKGVVINGRPIKLKKAIVVLKDICKSKSYNSGTFSDLIKAKKISDASSCTSSVLNEVSKSCPQIKTEGDSPSLKAQSPNESEKQIAENDNIYVNPFNSNNYDASNLESHCGENEEKKFSRMDSLTSLIEGCSFYDILRRFKEKQKRCTDVCLENLKTEAQDVKEDDKGLICSDNLLLESIVEPQKEELRFDQSHDSDLHETENISSSNSSAAQAHTEFCELNNSASPSIRDINNRVNLMDGGYGTEFQGTEVGSGDNEFANRSKLSSDSTEVFKVVEFQSTNNISDVVKSEFDVMETKIIVIDKEGQNSDFNLMEEEMVSPRKQDFRNKVEKFEKKNSRELCKNESSPKKMKQSPDSYKNSQREVPVMSSEDEGYIPLSIPGSTKFAVAPLGEVQKRKPHSAKNFKNDMLFGKRVNRFPSSRHLEVYKLKQKTAKSCINQK